MTRRLIIPVLGALLFFWLALNSMVGDSPTMDEQNHLARGLAFIRTGDPRLSLEHPPLINALSALPLLTLPNIRLPTDHPSWSQPQGWYEFADLLLWQYNHDVTRMIFLARLPIVFLALGLAVVGFRFAQALWGEPAGPIAFLLLLFDPNLLAHARYTTTDLGGTLFILLAAFLLWRHWRASRFGTWRFIWAGIGLGLAYSSKLSSLAFIPIFGLLAVLPLYGRGWSARRAAQRLMRFAIMNVIALAVVWASFGFQWGPLQFQTSRLDLFNGLAAPMPTFWAGVEQIGLISTGGRPAFLLGQTSTSGFPAYFPVAFLAKTPLTTLVLLLLTIWFLLIATRDTSVRQRGVFLLLPAGLYFLLSMSSGLNIGYRHLLPMLPFLYVAIAGALARLAQRSPAGASLSRWERLRPALPQAFVLVLIVETISIHPYYLSFFNLLAGGPANGYRILVDSNVDWGQDLLRLRTWMRENDVASVDLSWFGTADPAYYDISYTPLPGLPRHFDLWWDLPFNPQQPPPGVYAISVSNLWELPLQDEKVVFPWFRARPPDDRVGYSILIYDVH